MVKMGKKMNIGAKSIKLVFDSWNYYKNLETD
jgi:hypothetical protein